MRTLIFVALFFAGMAHAETESQQQAIEAANLEVLVDAQGQGMAIARGCDTCPFQATIDSETTFKVGNKIVTPAQAKLHSGKGGTLIYETGNKRAVKIHY